MSLVVCGPSNHIHNHPKTHYIKNHTLLSFETCLCKRHRPTGSLAGAVHLLNDNTGVPRQAQ